MSYDAIIIGAGAAGLYCAAHARKRGKRVLVLEHNGEVGAKILISGGGRCNFTNVDARDPARYLSANPHFARSALTRHPPSEFVALVRKHGIEHYEKTLGQLFCEGARASQKIVRMLLDECAGADIRTGCRVHGVTRGERFQVDTSEGALGAPALVIASGGLSIPKLGATDFGYRIAKQFKLPLIDPRPALVPLTFGADDLAWMKPLSGVSTPIVARAGKANFREAALFTHRGLSGPAILQISSYWRDGEEIAIDWAPDHGADFLAAAKRTHPKAQLKTALANILPERLAAALAATWTAGTLAGSAGAPSKVMPARTPAVQETQLGDMKESALNDIAQRVKDWRLTPAGTEGFPKAEVTAGGVSTDALSQQTLAARDVPGLFVIGEAVDVTGWLGGYNFQWAWSSAWAAAQAL